MKNTFLILSLFLPSFFALSIAHAQSKTTTTVTIEVDADPDDTPPLVQIEKAKSQLVGEEAEIKKILETSTDDCAKEEARLRQQDVDFAKKNMVQMSEIIDTISKGLKTQKTILSNFENGIASDEPQVQAKNAHGVTETTSIISFDYTPETGQPIVKEVSLKDLVRYIRKFEAEAKTIPDSPAEIEKFLDRYRQEATEHDPEYFNMTLEQAKRAFSERMGSVFQVSYTERYSRVLALGSGKNIFTVNNITRLGWDHKHGTVVGSGLRNAEDKSKNIDVTMIQSFSDAYNTSMKESGYWDVIRGQKLTIDGIPIDGLERRKYFDALRSEKCQKTVYEFNEKSDSGPYLPYSDKTECSNVGIEILSASLESSTGDSSKVFDFTAKLKPLTKGQYRFKLPAMADNVPASLLNNNTQLSVTYRCDCEKKSFQVVQIENLDMKKTRCGWGCESQYNDHLVGWNFQEMGNLLDRAKVIYGPGVRLKIETINDIHGYSALSAIDTVNRLGTQRADMNDILGGLIIEHVDTLPPSALPYRFRYSLVLPNGRTILPDFEGTLECQPKK